MTFENKKTFTRFKYAEEFASELNRRGVGWAMFRDDDIEQVEAGEVDGVPYRDVYVVPQIVVLWS